MSDQDRYSEAFARWMRVGESGLSAVERKLLATGRDVGGYRVPEWFRRQLIEAMERHRE